MRTFTILALAALSLATWAVPASAEFTNCRWAPFGGDNNFFPLPIFDNTNYAGGQQTDRYRLDADGNKTACGVASVSKVDLKQDEKKVRGFCFGYVTCEGKRDPFVVTCPRDGGCTERDEGATSCANGVSKGKTTVFSRPEGR
jgi:hypothetical protein